MRANREGECQRRGVSETAEATLSIPEPPSAAPVSFTLVIAGHVWQGMGLGDLRVFFCFHNGFLNNSPQFLRDESEFKGYPTP